ncbi:MAG: PKD domain-containing protein [Bacteroidia bacterium]|nr:PKD domain-containing protein [Bacteroidia bacterium]
MKKIYYLAILLPVILFSCTDKMPEAQFSTDAVEPEVGQEVFFNNGSKHADSYEWDFGDGVTSTAENPSHIFTGTGLFVVSLTAFNSSMEAVTTMDMEIFIPTLLEVDVFEWNSAYTYDNPIPDASVFLYPNLTSWDNQVNIYAEGYTDADGVVVFSHLNKQRFYVDVSHQNYNNYTLRDEDPGWIETDIVLPHKINWFIAWVDYVGAKGEMVNRRGGSYVIRKLERKVIDSDKPATTEGWQTLYNNSIKVK